MVLPLEREEVAHRAPGLDVPGRDPDLAAAREVVDCVRDRRAAGGHRRGAGDVAAAFRKGDFSTPGFVHGRDVPGTATMAARRAAIAYEARDLPGGGEVRITTADAEARRAVHAFLAFQRQDHRTGGQSMGADPHAGHAGHKP